jgi:hypothetical protein
MCTLMGYLRTDIAIYCFPFLILHIHIFTFILAYF